MVGVEVLVGLMPYADSMLPGDMLLYFVCLGWSTGQAGVPQLGYRPTR